MYPVIFTLAARAELIDAQDWYENEASDLGRRFRAAVDAAVQRISVAPHQFPVIYNSVRRVLLRRFPYALLFVIETDETLTVIACFPRQPRSRTLAKADVNHGTIHFEILTSKMD